MSSLLPIRPVTVFIYLLSLSVLSTPVFAFERPSQVPAQETSKDDPQAAADLKSLSFDAQLSEYQYALPVREFEFSSQGKDLEMAYVYMAGDGQHPVVTLLHGKNFNADYWTPTANFLHSQGYGVLIPDQIGFGKSSKPVDYQYSFSALANNTRQLMAELNIEQSIVVGHSMGGMLATRFALQYPSRTQKLILVNPIGLEDYLKYAEYKDVDFFYEMEKKKTAESIQAYQRKNYYDGNWNSDYEAMTYFMIGQTQGPDADQIAYVNALTYDMIFTQPVVNEFGNIAVSTHLILGTRDRTGPGRGWKREGVQYELGRYDQLGKKVSQQIPNAKLTELEGLGHLPQVEDFARFKEAFEPALKL